MAKERLNKFIAGAGIASRRRADELIKEGKVKVNGRIVTDLGTQVNPDKDKVEYQGKILKSATPLLFVFNKPVGVTSTMADKYAATTIADYFKKFGRVYPIGRLDKDSAGLMLVTNDGDLANKLMHPRYEHEKEYEVLIQRLPVILNRRAKRSLDWGSRKDKEQENSFYVPVWIPASAGMTAKNVGMVPDDRDNIIKQFSQRFVLDGYKTQPMQVKIIKAISPPHQSPLSVKSFRLRKSYAGQDAWLRPTSPRRGEGRRGCWLIALVLKEGRKRQIRRVAELLGYRVIQLKRVRIGKLKIGNLPIGKFRPVNPNNVI